MDIRRIAAACTMPAIGVRPPARTLVAVLAIAPVAGNPPNNGETMFAALHNDNRWTIIPEGNMLVNVDDACAKFPNARIIDALQQWPTAMP